MSVVPHLKIHWLEIILTCVLCVVEASHFRGATIQWRPVNPDGSAFNGEVSHFKRFVNKPYTAIAARLAHAGMHFGSYSCSEFVKKNKFITKLHSEQ